MAIPELNPVWPRGTNRIRLKRHGGTTIFPVSGLMPGKGAFSQWQIGLTHGLA
jgi:hypothetical protein